MAKIINMFAKGDEDKRVVANKNSNWREVLTGKEFDELSYDCYTFAGKWNFPVCNHKGCVNADNIGYVQGMLEDNRPFEAELFLGNGECTMGVIMPMVDEIEGVAASHGPRSARCLKNEKGNVLGFVKQVESQDNGVLPFGMVELGETDDLDITCKYVDYLEGLGVVKFLTVERNGYIEYYTDIHGTELVRVLITLQYANGEVVATTPFSVQKVWFL